MTISQGEEFDAVIVGAGISGLYFTLKIIKSSYFQEIRNLGREPRIAILDSENRTGGRILTQFFKDAPDLPVELGAMRILENHVLTNKLIKRYNLETIPFPQKEEKKYYLRGQSLTQNDFKTKKRNFFNLSKTEQEKTPDELLLYTLSKIFNCKLENFKEKKYPQKIKLPFSNDFIELNDIGIGNLLSHYLSNEALQLIIKSSGYSSNFINWNSADAIPYILRNFNKKNNAITLKRGMSDLTRSIEKELEELGVQFFLNHSLIQFETSKEYQKKVLLKVNNNNNKTVTVSSKKIILALPRDSLRRIHQNNSFFKNVNTKKILNSVVSQKAVKLYLKYESAWWTKKMKDVGPIASDEYLQMTYNLSRNWLKASPSKGVILAAYSELDHDNFWKEFLKLEDDANKKERLLNFVHNKLVKILNCSTEHKPISYLYKDWSDEPFGAAYHAWSPGNKSKDLIKLSLKPVHDEPIYICGEAFSNLQGWIEGALSSADSLFNEHFYRNKSLTIERKAA